MQMSIWGALYADDDDIVPKSVESFAKMMTVIVTFIGAVGLTVS